MQPLEFSISLYVRLEDFQTLHNSLLLSGAAEESCTSSTLN